MSMETLLPAQLLTCNDDDFYSHIKNMPAKSLMEVITVLQQEMESEQERFNSLSISLHGLCDRNSRQYKSISNDMTSSQVRLTTLMNRSMQCFSQLRQEELCQKNLQKNKQDMQLHHIKNANHVGLQNPSSAKPTYKQCIKSTGTTYSDKASSNTVAFKVHEVIPVSSLVPHGNISQADLRDISQADPLGSHPVTQQQPISEGDLNGILGNSATSKTSFLNIHPQTSLIGSSVAISSKQNKSQIVMSSFPSCVPLPDEASSGKQKVFKGLPSVRQLAQTFGAKLDKFPQKESAVVTNRSRKEVPHSTVSGSAYLSVSPTNLDRKKSSSSIVLVCKPGDQDTLLVTSSAKINQAPFGGMRRAQSREELHSVASKAYLQKDALLQEIHLKHSKEVGIGSGLCRNKFVGNKSSGVAQNESSTSKQQLQQVDVTSAPASALSGAEESESGSVAKETVENASRPNLKNWDPKPVLEQLYKIQLMEETVEDISCQFISMEGLMEKLPMNKKKSTLLKTWKRCFFRAKDGWLEYYEKSNQEKPSEIMQLMGGHIDDMGNRILGIDDGRGHYLMVRAPTEKEYGQWKVALESQTADNTRATYVHPVLHSPPHPSLHVAVIDLGSSAIRAGILGQQISLPQVFFPSVVAVSKTTGDKVVGMDAYHPSVRHNSNLFYPVQPSCKIDQFNINVELMSAIFGKVISDLKINPTKYMVMLSTPQKLSDSLKAALMSALIDGVGVRGVCIVEQSLLALHSYRATSGIIVDIGNRIEILPIYDGFVIESGVSRCPYGSQKIVGSLKNMLLENNYKFSSDTELLLVRYIMEQVCYVARNFQDEERLCNSQSGKLQLTVNLAKFNMPEGAHRSVQVEEGRFKSPEGFFNADLWEMDYPTLHKLIHQAIQSCPVDNRRHMCRAVYLSGGVTMLPGFVDRLQYELTKLAPPGVKVEVHASPHRLHAAYLGACSVASMPRFQDMAISCSEWRREGVRAFTKWQAPSF